MEDYNAGLLLAERRRRWANISPALGDLDAPLINYSMTNSWTYGYKSVYSKLIASIEREVKH